jgi:hypothetical protein
MVTFTTYRMGKCGVCEQWYRLGENPESRELVVIEHRFERVGAQLKGLFCSGSFSFPTETRVVE